MKTTLAQDTTNTAKSLAQRIAKQMAREPLEILKDAKEQAVGGTLNSSGGPQENQSDDQKKLLEQQGQLNDRMKSGRRMEALNRELDDIHKQKKFSELQKRISAGEEIFLEEHPEISMEQKQVLKAQMEAVKVQNSKLKVQNELVEPATHKGRQLFNFGKKQEVKRQQTRVEKPVPPSG